MALKQAEVNWHRLQKKRVYFFMSRFCDVIFSILGLIILSPLLLVIALLIKWDNPHAPVIFSQDRVGKDGIIFKMFKFRTMVPDAEKHLKELLKYNEVEGAMFKMKNDPRVTPIGAFLRRTSLDELPQLWNVIKGEMSLVGPRPPLIREVEMYTEYDKQRLLVRPGCTGLWQVSGRNELSFEEMVQLDIQFINHLSMKQYFCIIFKTFGVFFRKKGAY